MKIEIDTEEAISVVAICLSGWGKGKTLHEALRNMKKASRGLIDTDYGMTLYPNNKKKKYYFADSVEGSQIGIWLTNDDSVTTEWYQFKPSEGKWAIFLGNADNNALAYINTAKED